jgi:DUF4097 and DUF4098 domain-containing protein YvlB
VISKDVEKTIVEMSYKVYGGVTEENLENFLRENTIIESENGHLTINIKSKRIVSDLTITLPAKILDEVTFDIVNGAIQVKDLFTERLTVKKVNGDFAMLDGKADKLKLKTVNGEIRVATDFEIADITGVNGEILITATSIDTETLKVKNVNGDVKISVPKNIGLIGYIKTTFGKYKTKIDLDSPLEITKNGAALVRKAKNSLTLDVATNTGSVWLKDGKVYQTAPDVFEQTENSQNVEGEEN